MAVFVGKNRIVGKRFNVFTIVCLQPRRRTTLAITAMVITIRLIELIIVRSIKRAVVFFYRLTIVNLRFRIAGSEEFLNRLAILIVRYRLGRAFAKADMAVVTTWFSIEALRHRVMAYVLLCCNWAALTDLSGCCLAGVGNAR